MKLTVDFSKSVGKIKAMHAVGQPPIYGMNFQYFDYPFFHSNSPKIKYP